MALIHSFEKSGNLLFKYRGQIPAFIFVLSLPILSYSNFPLYTCLAKGECQIFYLVMAIVAILISLIGFSIRAYTIGTTPRGTSGRNTEKQVASQLNTTGIYSIVRHPLYLANYLMWLGLLVFTMNIYAIIIVSLIYWIYYERIMFAEERFLEKQFGQSFLDWSMTVPPFIPAFARFKKSSIPFSFKSVLRREYTTLFSICLAYTIVDYYLTLIIAALPTDYQTFCAHYTLNFWLRPSLFVLLFVFVLMIILRTLKHHSNILQRQENRD